MQSRGTKIRSPPGAVKGCRSHLLQWFWHDICVASLGCLCFLPPIKVKIVNKMPNPWEKCSGDRHVGRQFDSDWRRLNRDFREVWDPIREEKEQDATSLFLFWTSLVVTYRIANTLALIPNSSPLVDNHLAKSKCLASFPPKWWAPSYYQWF
jgi:hypothetical protein